MTASRFRDSSVRRFVKMHGLGNDFVVIDARDRPLALDEGQARAIADRRTGVGCDQLIVIEKPATGGADAFMRIRNADGGEVATCGNATRCVADLIMNETGRERLVIETKAGLLDAARAGEGRIAVDLGRARHDWRDIPLSEPQDTLHLDLHLGPLTDPAAVGLGNPHAVFFVADVARIDLDGLGPVLERHRLFPERANIGIAQILAPDRIRLRVWERGTGITRACASGACAAVVAGARRGLLARRAVVVLDGGELEVEWLASGHVWMSGPVAVSFRGELALS
ncbi:MAG: diaminopimelate epimerase [Pseudomonadota bacterium]